MRTLLLRLAACVVLVSLVSCAHPVKTDVQHSSTEQNQQSVPSSFPSSIKNKASNASSAFMLTLKSVSTIGSDDGQMPTMMHVTVETPSTHSPIALFDWPEGNVSFIDGSDTLDEHPQFLGAIATYAEGRYREMKFERSNGMVHVLRREAYETDDPDECSTPWEEVVTLSVPVDAPVAFDQPWEVKPVDLMACSGPF